ncbi:hypothetical protein [Actinophytocola sp.]|uniref:hypothetical protein n=1 Tax=Actinophytocola sp. TaxID=1872138 RepID=UPI002D34B5B3|nr:hypothetical protein [Actinophytocola sp.]HYQ69770.1 hypothetical protein [Actinophytocola sp.]
MTTNPRRRARTATTRDGRPLTAAEIAEERERVVGELVRLAEERRKNRVAHKKNTDKFGPKVKLAAEYGWKYAEQSEHYDLARGVFNRHGGVVEVGSKRPRGDALERLKVVIGEIVDERFRLDREYKQAAETMAELVERAYNELGVNLRQLELNCKVPRSTLYSWLGLAHSNPRLGTDGKPTRSVNKPIEPSGPRKGIPWQAREGQQASSAAAE